MTQEEKQFLDNYDPGKYPRPSVTVDMAIFTIKNNRLHLLLIKRGGWPDKGKYALPGGFLMANQESAEQAARRELYEETKVDTAYLKQLYTFSDPNRDPRTHVISIAYMALIPRDKLVFTAGDDAAEADLFQIEYQNSHLELRNATLTINEADLAFDHATIIKTAIDRLRGRIEYEPDAFELLQNKSSFTLLELKMIFEDILNKPLDPGNFRKMFNRNYLNTGYVSKTDDVLKRPGCRPAALYKVN